MKRVTSPEDLAHLREEFFAGQTCVRRTVIVCGGTGCMAGGAAAVHEALSAEIARTGLAVDLRLKMSGCHGFCQRGPVVVVQPDEVFYQYVKPADVPALVEAFAAGNVVDKLLYRHPVSGRVQKTFPEIDFYRLQTRIALRHCGRIDPTSIDEYIAEGGYRGLQTALTRYTPDQVIDLIERSGLRGRGGGGFPTGRKWRSGRKAEGERRYVLCNGDEGDPGAFMDRSIMEGDPHSVIEGMIIGAYALGSDQGYIYVRHEYPLAVRNLGLAIDSARERGLLGSGIMGTGFSFDIGIVRGGGAFVCGESTALMASIEGRAGEPRAKYVHTVERGLRDMPTVLNNVETWNNVPVIVERGVDWYTAIGTAGSKGTKVFSLVGKVNNTGLVEVPMGATIGHIVEEIGGGVPGGRPFKAVQTGGPSGGCIPYGLKDLPVDFDELTKVGSMMGSGGMIVMDENDCMVDVARYFLNFLQGESCGKCTACREGVRRMHEILARICDGKGEVGDLPLLERLADGVIWGSLCALGGSAPNPLLTTLKYFRDEYEAHINEKRCPAGVCTSLITIRINPQACTGCTLCAKKCPVGCIHGERKGPHAIDQSKCIKCKICRDVCPVDAVEIR